MNVTPRWRAEHLLLALDLVGTALFAAEGAATAVTAHLDVLGILVLGFVTALGGGIIRDVLIGDTPPAAIRDWRYAAISFAAAAALAFVHPRITGPRISPLLTTLDAAGLAFFAITGAAKALEFKLHPVFCVIMGGITGVGGGTLRDILINRIPRVLESDIYAVAALFGSSVMILGLSLRLGPAVASTAGILACFVIRILAVHFGWNLPHPSA